jgi:ribosomal protein L20A (L18A)
LEFKFQYLKKRPGRFFNGDKMAKFLVNGTTSTGGVARPFEKQVEAASEKLARETTYSLFGSNAGIKRSAIKIASVEKI